MVQAMEEGDYGRWRYANVEWAGICANLPDGETSGSKIRMLLENMVNDAQSGALETRAKRRSIGTRQDQKAYENIEKRANELASAIAKQINKGLPKYPRGWKAKHSLDDPQIAEALQLIEAAAKEAAQYVKTNLRDLGKQEVADAAFRTAAFVFLEAGGRMSLSKTRDGKPSGPCFRFFMAVFKPVPQLKFMSDDMVRKRILHWKMLDKSDSSGTNSARAAAR